EQCHQDLTQLDQPAAQDQVERHLMEDPVGTLRLRAPVAVRPTTTISSAIQTMLDHNIGAVLVVDDRGSLVGIFSERDLLTRVAAISDDLGDKAVSEFRPKNPRPYRAMIAWPSPRTKWPSAAIATFRYSQTAARQACSPSAT